MDDTSWKTRTLLVGAILGAFTGVGTAYIFVKRAEESEGGARLTSKDGLSLGLILLGALRQIAKIGTDD